MSDKFYTLPPLPYAADSLEPVISAAQLKLHRDKHHNAYVENANKILETLDLHEDGLAASPGDIYKKLSFNAGGHLLHSLYWDNMKSPSEVNSPSPGLMEAFEKNYGGLENFKSQFLTVGTSIEGSGWAALFYCEMTDRLLIGQIQNHNLNVYPAFQILLVMDMWEHAYYLDYKNDKKTFAEKFWSIVNWEAVSGRYLKTAQK